MSVERQTSPTSLHVGVVVGPGSPTPGVQSVYWVGSVEARDDVVEEDEDHRKGKGQEHHNILSKGEVRRFSQGSRYKKESKKRSKVRHWTCPA